MNKTVTQALVLSLLACAASAHASVILFEAATSTAGSQSSAAAYQSVVNAALTQAGARQANISLFDNVSNHSVFGASSSDIAFRSTISFGVTADQAGSWDLRAGVDFGKGGAMFLDGVALGFMSNDMWWGGSYASPTQSFSFNSVNISAGNHTLQLFGLEGCCDGGQQAQFAIKGAGFQSFGSSDGLAAAAVPEPSSYALILAGLGAMGLIMRRRSSAT